MRWKDTILAVKCPLVPGSSLFSCPSSGMAMPMYPSASLPLTCGAAGSFSPAVRWIWIAPLVSWSCCFPAISGWNPAAVPPSVILPSQGIRTPMPPTYSWSMPMPVSARSHCITSEFILQPPGLRTLAVFASFCPDMACNFRLQMIEYF